jgi:Rps23 Pro-64 3,4-dihydroxylase Tpa1-like proline 4-hydroxylase
MIKISKDILDIQTFKQLEIICKDFDNKNFDNIQPELGNYYVRLFIKKDMLIDYINNAKKYLVENLTCDEIKKIDFDDSVSWINKVSIETNKNDAFHNDSSILTIITYLNDDFEGGELIYINKNKEKDSVIPQKNMTIIMNDKLSHKVNRVSDGIRYSLITFFQTKQKRTKTLI